MSTCGRRADSSDVAVWGGRVATTEILTGSRLIRRTITSFQSIQPFTAISAQRCGHVRDAGLDHLKTMSEAVKNNSNIKNSSRAKITLDSWGRVFGERGYCYSIYPYNEKYATEVSIFLESTSGSPGEDRVVCVPLQRFFGTAQEAFEWLELEDPFAVADMCPDRPVFVVDDSGAVVAEWKLGG